MDKTRQIKNINLYCKQVITADYSKFDATCGAGCCSGLYSGEDTFTFEVGEVYEFEVLKEKDNHIELVHDTDCMDRVYVNFDDDRLLAEYFEPAD